MKRLLSLILTVAILVGTLSAALPANVFAAETVKPLTHGNDAIFYSVNENGHFSIRTTEEGSPYRSNDGNLSLLYEDGANNTSFATFRVNGEDYIFGERYLYSLSQKAAIKGTSQQTDDSIITTYGIGEGIEIQQILTFVTDTNDTNYGNVFIRYVVNNQSGADINIGARLLQDIMLGDNDGVAVKVDDSFYDKEIEFVGSDVPDVWRATDNEFGPNVVAYGYTNGWGNDKPDRMIVGHWQGLSQSAYEYTPNNQLNFTMESDYGQKDTAVAYYWDPQKLGNDDTLAFETYYGLGQLVGTELTYATNIFAPTQMVVNEEQTGYTDNGEFEIAVMIENNLDTSVELYDVMAYLTLESRGGAVQLDNDASLKGVKLIKKNGQYTFRWKLKATAGEDYNSIRYKVDLYDSRNIYKEGDSIPQGAQVGDVKLDEIYSVSKGLILPSKTGAPPSVGFEAVSPDEIYYSGKNLVTIKTSGINLLIEKSNWELEYSLNDGEYTLVPAEAINVMPETNSLDINFEQQFEPGEMTFRMRVVKDLYTDGTDEENILQGDILYVPGALKVTKDKAAMQRSYGMIAVMEEYKNGHTYTLPIVVADEVELKALRQAITAANGIDGEERQILLTISGDVRSIRENGQVVRYVVYAQHKKALINDLITYTSAIPMTIEYAKAWKTPTRNSIDYSAGMEDGLSATLRAELDKTSILSNMFPEGSDNPGIASDLDLDFPYTSMNIGEMTDAAKAITGVSLDEFTSSDMAASEEFVNGSAGRLTVSGMGVLGMNSKDGFDFWMDKFNMEFLDDKTYSLTEGQRAVQMDLGGIGSVLNKVLEGMPVQIGGVRLVEDPYDGKQMLTFDATVDLTMVPGDVVVNAKDVYFSQEGFEGLIVDTHVQPDGDLGMVEGLDLDVGIDTYNNIYSINGSGQVGIVEADVEFTIVKERRNNTWYLDTLVLAGGGEPGIPVIAGVVYIDKLGGGVRNLQELTNPYYEGGGKIFTVVLIAGVNIVDVIQGDFVGEINKRNIQVTADEAEIFGMDILRDMQWKLTWQGDDGSDYFYMSQKASLNIGDIIVGSYKLGITKTTFEGTAKAAVKIPDSVDLVGGMEVGKASLGLNLEKVWGSVGINLPWPLPTVSLGATYFWRGSFKFNVGEAGPVLNGPEGALYYGSFVDENNQTIEYVIGTNVNEVDGSMSGNGIKSMKPLTVLKDNGGYATFSEMAPEEVAPETSYAHVDGVTTFDGKYVYPLTLTTTEGTNLVLKHTTGDPLSDSNVSVYAMTGELQAGKIMVDNTQDTLAVAEHVIGTEEYDTVTGFTAHTAKEYLVVSETPLNRYLTYTDGEDYNGFDNPYTYELTMDTTQDTRLAFTHDESMDIKIYKVNTGNPNGLAYIDEATGVTKKTAEFNGKHIVVFEGFPDGELGATYYISSTKALTQQNLLDAKKIEIPKSTSPYGSIMVAQLFSQEDIMGADVFYITDASGNVLEFFTEGSASSKDPNYKNLFGESTVNGTNYHTMMYPFEAEGDYYIYSTADMDIAASHLYEIQAMPELGKESLLVKNNAQSSEKRDIYWEGKNYRYLPDEVKGTGKTVFTFYLADENLTLDEDGEPIYEPERLLSIYEPREGDDDVYTVDMPRDLPTGSYRVLTVMSTEGLSQEFAYSPVFDYVNPNMPKPVTQVDVTTNGNGYFHVAWADNETVESYYLEVYDESETLINAFGTAEVSGDLREAIIGGIYENFDPNHPEEGTVTGLEVGKNYRVGVTPVKKVDDTLRLVGETTYSDVAYLPEPNPATLGISLTGTDLYSRSSEVAVVKEDGSTGTETIEIQGTKDKNPKLHLTADQEVTYTVYLNREEIETTTQGVTEATIETGHVTEGLNVLDIVAKNSDGDITTDSFMFYVDSRAPELMISEPASNTYVDGQRTTVHVAGKTEVGGVVTVNGTQALVNEEGFFTADVAMDMNTTATSLLIEAKDDFNNVTQSKMAVLRNLEPITGIKIESDIPVKEQTYYKPIYKETFVDMVNPFTGQTVQVPMSDSDEVESYTEELVTTNVVEMGKTYQLDITGVGASGTEIPLDPERLEVTIVDGQSIGSIQPDQTLKVTNSGTIVLEASYALMDDDNGNGDGKTAYAFKKYLTVTSDYRDIYADLPEPEPGNGGGNNGGNNGGGNGGGNHSGTTTPPKTELPTTTPSVKDRDGKGVGQLEVKDTLQADGTTRRDISLTENQAKEVTKNNELIRLVIPKDDAITDTYIHIPKATLTLLREKKTDVSVESNGASVQVKIEALGAFIQGNDDELYFRIEPVTGASDKGSILQVAKADKEVSDKIGNQTIRLEGSPMHIETNMGSLQSGTMDVVIPIEGTNLPSNLEERIAYLKGLAVYVQHDDNTTELLPAHIVTMTLEDGTLGYGARVSVNRFSVFSLFSIEDYTESVVDERDPYMTGYPDQTFKPDQGITRGELATILSRVIEDSITDGDVLSFTDVQGSYWAHDAVAMVNQLGLMTGVGNDRFEPNRSITRGEMATIVARWLKLSGTSDTTFTDTDHHWAKNNIALAADAGIFNGYGDGSFNPNGLITRAEVTAVMNRILGRTLMTMSVDNPFKDVSVTAWYYQDILEATVKHAYTMVDSVYDKAPINQE